MSVSEPGVPARGDPPATACPLCGTPVAPRDTRCPDCNMTLDGVGGRSPAFDRQALWLWALGLLVLYVAVLLVILAAR